MKKIFYFPLVLLIFLITVWGARAGTTNERWNQTLDGDFATADCYGDTFHILGSTPGNVTNITARLDATDAATRCVLFNITTTTVIANVSITSNICQINALNLPNGTNYSLLATRTANNNARLWNGVFTFPKNSSPNSYVSIINRASRTSCGGSINIDGDSHVTSFTEINFTVTTADPNTFTITAKDANSLVSINNFNATLKNGTQTFVYNTTNGTITTPWATNAGLWNISVQGECGGGFCNYSLNNYTPWNLSSNLQANLSYWYTSTINYTNVILGLANQSITLFVNYSAGPFDHNITGISGILFWNGTYYSPFSSSFTNATLFNATFLIPYSFSNATKNFTWYVNLTRQSGVNSQVIQFNNSGSQTVLFVGIDNCSNFSTLAYNFTLLNLSSGSPLYGSAAAYFELWIGSMSTFRAFNFSWGNSTSFPVCVAPASASTYVYSQMIYTPNSLSPQTYYLTNASLGNNTVVIPLYASGAAVPVLMTFTDEFGLPVVGAYVFIQHYVVGTNTAITDQIVKTDGNGEAIAQIVLVNQYYKIIVVLNNQIVLLDGPLLFSSNTKDFTIGGNSPVLTDYNTLSGISGSITTTNTSSTTTFTYTYTDPSGRAVGACLAVQRQIGTATNTVQTTCVTGASGTINVVTNNTGIVVGSLIGTATVSVSGQYYPGGSKSVAVDTRALSLASQAGLMLVVFILSMIGAFNDYPLGALLGSGVVVYLLTWAGFLSLGTGALGMFFIVAGIFIASKVMP